MARPALKGTRLWLAALVVLVACAPFLIPAPPSVQKGLFLLAVAGGLWFTEATHLTVTALLVPLLAAGTGLLSVKRAFAAFADPVIAMFFGGFLLAAALRRHALDRLLAARLVGLAHGRLLPAALLLFAATAFLSMWVSNTATAVLMLPLALGLAPRSDGDGDRRTGQFLVLGVAWMASIGGMGSLVGSPPNALAAAAGGWTFTAWLGVGVPAVLLLVPLATLTLLGVIRPRIAGRRIDSSARAVSFVWTTGAISTLAVFAVAVAGWLLGEPLAIYTGIREHFDSLVAVGAAAALLASGTLDWEDARRDVDWGTLVLFGGGLCLGGAVEASGAHVWLAHGVMSAANGLPRIALMIALAAFVITLSEVASNTATTALLMPVLMPLGPTLGLDGRDMAAFIALTASCGFMLPVATPPNAIAFGTGLIPQSLMIRAGAWLNVICGVVIVALFA